MTGLLGFTSGYMHMNCDTLAHAGTDFLTAVFPKTRHDVQVDLRGETLGVARGWNMDCRRR